MGARSGHIQDEFGRPVPGASVYVYDANDALASLTSDGTTHFDNPLTTDAFGNYSYEAADGIYREDVWFGGRLRWSEAGIALGVLAVTSISAGASVNVRALLAEIPSPIADQSAILTESGREGMFVFDSSDLSANVAADTQQGIYVAPASDPTGASGAWVRTGDVLTPTCFGAARYDLSNEVDASAGLQAFFNAFQNENIAKRYTGDWSGEWMVKQTIYAVFSNGGTPNVERKFKVGTLRIAPLASLAVPNVPLDWAMVVAGYEQHWEGNIGIHPSGSSQVGFSSYYSRPIQNGVLFTGVSNSTFGDVLCDCARRDGMVVDTLPDTFTYNGVTIPNGFCESTKFGMARARNCGSCSQIPNCSPTALVPTTRTQGGNTNPNGAYSAAEVFSAGTAGFADSLQQRTLIAGVASTADLAILDNVWARVELTAAIYGTIAAAVVDANTGTFTWTAGDPTNIDGAGHGLAVGDIYPAFIAGPNAGTEFRIVSFGGTSNRTITVTPVPTAHAASVFDQNGEKQWFWVANIIDGQSFTVYPWVPERLNSTFHIHHGYALHVAGSDLANCQFEGAVTNICGGAYHLSGLYAPKIGTVLQQTTDVGVRIGSQPLSSCIGFNIEHGHMGIVDSGGISLLSDSMGNAYGTMTPQSQFDFETTFLANPRHTTNQQRPSPSIPFVGQLMKQGGVVTEIVGNRSTNEGGNYGIHGISNKIEEREVFAPTNGDTFAVSLDFDLARLVPNCYWAKLHWVGTGGGAPSGTIIFNLEPRLIGLGWTFAGAGSGTSFSVTAPGRSQIFEFVYIIGLKIVAVTQINSASAAITPISVAATGAITTTAGGVGYATGAGGTVTQATSKSTGVTLNKLCGEITMNAAALAAATAVSFVLTNSQVAASDNIILNHVTTGTFGSYSLNGRCAAGSASIDVRNNSAGSLSEAIVIRFTVIKSVTA